MTSPSPYDAVAPFPERFNLVEYFLDHNLAAGRGDKLALACGQEQRTYAQLVERSRRVAAALRRAGVRPEERVLLVLPDGFEFAEAWFGLLRAGAVFAMVNPLLKRDDYAYYLEYSKARVVVAHASALEELGPLFAGFGRYLGSRVVLPRWRPEDEVRHWRTVNQPRREERSDSRPRRSCVRIPIGAARQVRSETITMAEKSFSETAQSPRNVPYCMMTIAISARGIMLTPSRTAPRGRSATRLPPPAPRNLPPAATRKRSSPSGSAVPKPSGATRIPIAMKKKGVKKS